MRLRDAVAFLVMTNATDTAAGSRTSQINPSPGANAQLWEKFSDTALKRAVFSAFYRVKAPYFRTVMPRVREAVPGRCVVRLGKWWGVQNHIGTFHVIAGLNGA